MKADYQHGIPIGEYNREKSEIIIYNHLVMTVKTHWEAGSDNQRIVGFEIEPKSVDYRETLQYDPLDRQTKQILKAGKQFKFTYEIKTVNDETTFWAHRMDHYFKIGNHQI